MHKNLRIIVLMKKLIYLFGMLVLSVSFFSCGSSEEEKVKDVVGKFRTAVQDLKFEEASTYCEAKTAEMIKSLGGLMAMMPQENKDKLKKEKFEISKVEFNKDTATVHYWEGETIDKTAETKTMELIKIDGNWKIYMNKDSANKEGKEGQDKKSEFEPADDSTEESSMMEEPMGAPMPDEAVLMGADGN